MWTAKFWKDATERAVKTAAQAALAFWAVGDGMFNALEADWVNTGGVALGGAILSYVMSLASTLRADPDTASLVNGHRERGTPRARWGSATGGCARPAR